MLRAQRLEITFNPGTPIENRALRGLDLEIPAGQFVTVIGSNGAGKSTFLNAISGDLMVDRGSIHIDESEVTRRSAWQRSDLVARVFQDPMAGTCEALTIEENMALAWKRGARRGFGFSLTRPLRELFREKLSILGLGLENRLADRMGLLSGGQRQAVSLLMASLQPSRILLLDEHTAALDPKSADQVIRISQEVVERDRLTTMMVTHSMAQATHLGDRLIMMYHGRIIHDFRGAEKRRLRVEDLLARFEEVRRAEQLDETAAEMLKRAYV
jgi:putative tryptophan/tyrosine transport system ATP-binding protein